MISQVSTYTKLLQYYLLYPYAMYIPVAYLFYNWRLVPLNPLHLFCTFPPYLLGFLLLYWLLLLHLFPQLSS